MATVAQIHRQHLVAGLQHGEIDGHVGLAAGVRLDIGVFRAEKFFRAVNRELLDHVNIFAAETVPTVKPPGLVLQAIDHHELLAVMRRHGPPGALRP